MSEHTDPLPPRVPARPAPEPAAPKQKDVRSDEQLRADIAKARNELAATLDALEFKLDVPARGKELLSQGRRTLRRTWDENPLLAGGIVAGAIVVAAGATAAIIALRRR